MERSKRRPGADPLSAYARHGEDALRSAMPGLPRHRGTWGLFRDLRRTRLARDEDVVSSRLEQAIFLLSRAAGPIVFVAALGALLWFLVRALA